MNIAEREKIYDEIVKYYDYANRLAKILEENSQQISDNNFEIIESLIDFLERGADQLTAQYIEYIKSGKSSKTKEIINMIFDAIDKKIAECQKNLC